MKKQGDNESLHNKRMQKCAVASQAQMQHGGVNKGYEALSFTENKGIKEKKNGVVAGSMTADPAVVCGRESKGGA